MLNGPTYTIETTDERFNGEQLRILNITTEVLGTSTVRTSTFLVQIEEGIKLHRIVAELGGRFWCGTSGLFTAYRIFPTDASTWGKMGDSWGN